MPVTQGIVSVEKSPSAFDDLNTTNKSKRADIDPANPQGMSSVINSDLSLTDKTKPFSTVLDKLSSGTSKMRASEKNKIIKFHGKEVKNVIIHYTISKGKPKNVVKKEFDASKIKLQFETVNVQVVADYITITQLANSVNIDGTTNDAPKNEPTCHLIIGYGTLSFCCRNYCTQKCAIIFLSCQCLII
jgi:hypothetical protein